MFMGSTLIHLKRTAYWVTVGDFEGECHLLCTQDRFKTFTVLLEMAARITGLSICSLPGSQSAG